MRFHHSPLITLAHFELRLLGTFNGTNSRRICDLGSATKDNTYGIMNLIKCISCPADKTKLTEFIKFIHNFRTRNMFVHLHE